MDKTACLPSLRRVGVVLIAVGTVDTTAMIYCVLNQIKYSSSVNILAVIAGVCLWRGNLRVAGIIAFLSALFLSTQLCLIVSTALIEPVGLTIAYLRLHPASLLLLVATNGILIGVLFWTLRSLTQPPILDARTANGAKIISPRIPTLLGVGITFLTVWMGTGMTGGEIGRHAKELAAVQLGNGYSYYVTSYTKTYDGHSTLMKAKVTAWNDRAIQNVSVEWQEQ